MTFDPPDLRAGQRSYVELLRGSRKEGEPGNEATHLACELSMRGGPVADGVAWPIPSISGAHAHYAYSSTAHAHTCIAYWHMVYT